jgi:hypothetical protein
MAAKDGFDPGDSLPLFLSAGKPEQKIEANRAVILLRGLMVTATIAICALFAGKPKHGIRTDRAVISPRVVSILAAAAIAICIAILSNQVTLFANVTTSLVDKSAPQPGTDLSTPIIQSAVFRSTVGVEALPTTAKDAPTHEISTSEPASRTETENKEALFRQFQAWAAEQDARALARPAQDTPALVAENPPAPVRPMQKQRRAARPVKDTRAQSAQNAEAPSFLQTLFGATQPQRGRP